MFKTANKTNNRLTVKEIGHNVDMLKVFQCTHAYSDNFFLDSALVKQGVGRYSFIGFNPFLTITTKGRNIRLQDHRGITEKIANPFEELRNLLAGFNVDGHFGPLPFTCGAVGYFAYDLCHFIEKLPDTTRDDIQFPEMYFGFYDTIIGFDHLENKCYTSLINFSPYSGKNAKERLNQVTKLIGSKLNAPENKKPEAFKRRLGGSITSNFSKESYLRAVEKTKQYIYAGDIYQVNLSQRFQTQIECPPYEIYTRLRGINPAPFSCYLKFGDKHVISSSPERFLSVRNMPDNGRKGQIVRRVQTRPIKGTRPRHSDKEIDNRMKEDLLASKKDDAELTMIVDLERNDLGRVCNYNTVKVTENRVLEEHPTVFHLVATVEGELHPRYDVIDLVKSTFPGGSVTGAPKIRAMQIIDSLEPTKRSVYTGAIGYIGFDGNVDFNIAIRTFLVNGRNIHFQVGGGIVADSSPEQEYEETLHKAKALIKTLE